MRGGPGGHTEGRRRRRRRPMRFGYFLSCEEYTPEQLVEQARLGGGGRLRRAVDQRPLPPVEQRAGPEPVRVVGDRRDLPGVRPARDHGGHLPDRAHPPGGDRAGRGDQRGDARREVHARRRLGEALNEHILGDAWPTADVRLAMLEEAVDVIRQLSPARRSRTAASTTPSTRPDLHAPRPAAADLRLRLRPEGASTLAARIGDGYINTAPDAELLGAVQGEVGRQARRRPG